MRQRKKRHVLAALLCCILTLLCVSSSAAVAADYEQPAISKVADVTVKDGEEASFAIWASSGVPDTYTYQWYEAFSISEQGSPIEGATSSTFTISADDVTMEYDGRYYYCVVSNGAYSVISNYALLTVKEKIVYVAPVISHVSDVTVKSKEAVIFSIEASLGVPDTYTYQWYEAFSTSEQGSPIEGADSSNYQIPSNEVTADLNGRYYYCVVSNEVCMVKSNYALLTVQEEGSSEDPGENENPGENEKPGENDHPSTNQPPGGNGNSGNNENPGEGGEKPGGSNGGGTVKRKQTIKGVSSSYKLDYGKKEFSLKAKASGKGKLTYHTSNRKVAKVSAKGKVSIKGCGTATITIKASATAKYKQVQKKVSVTVLPPKVKVTGCVSPYSNMIKIKWKKDKTVDGYELSIAMDAKFRNAMSRSCPKSKTSTIGGGFKNGKTYYVRMRSYKKAGKKTYHSSWSAVKKVRVK